MPDSKQWDLIQMHLLKLLLFIVLWIVWHLMQFLHVNFLYKSTSIYNVWDFSIIESILVKKSCSHFFIFNWEGDHRRGICKCNGERSTGNGKRQVNQSNRPFNSEPQDISNNDEALAQLAGISVVKRDGQNYPFIRIREHNKCWSPWNSQLWNSMLIPEHPHIQ